MYVGIRQPRLYLHLEIAMVLKIDLKMLLGSFHPLHVSSPCTFEDGFCLLFLGVILVITTEH